MVYSVYRMQFQSMATSSRALTRLAGTPDLADRVYQALVEAISSGALAPGSRLLQEDIAARLAVSRQPVLQALRLLRNDGLVLEAPGRGVLVAPLDALTIERVYQVRGALDALAARMAAGQGARIDPALFDAGRAAVRGGDVTAMIDADLAFHNAVYAASGNPLVEQTARLHWCHLRRAMGASLQNSARRERVWDEHEAIARAIADGRVDAAELLIRQHAERASEDLVRRLATALGQTEPETLDATHA
jgi:DNA-binding GntR family transcriptional regulator